MILENGKILTSDQIWERIAALGLSLPINLNDPKQRETLDKAIKQRDEDLRNRL